MRQPAQFEYRDEFADFLPQNGVPNAVETYLSWANRAVKLLGRRFGPSELSSEADVQRLVSEIELVRREKRTWRGTEASDRTNFQSTFRKYMQMVQSNYRGLFANVPAAPAPVASDVQDAPPERVKQTVHRIIRDTKTGRAVKRLYEFCCQVCGERLEIEPGVFYAEGHHIQPLGGKHKGHDVKGNILCLCPNHHALFDYFAITLDPSKLRWNKHALGQSFVDYHNAHVKKGEIVAT